MPCAWAITCCNGFDGHSKIGAWLHRIVINTCLMKRRAAKSRPVVSIESLLSTFDETGRPASRISGWHVPSDGLETDEPRATVRRCMDEFPETHRVVRLLRDIEELNTPETAERLGIGAPAVKVRPHRTRQALRTLLDPTSRADRELA